MPSFMILPILEGWKKDSFILLSSKTIPAGGSHVPLEVRDKSGWIYSIAGTVSDPAALITVRVDDELVWEKTITDVYLGGHTAPNNALPYVPVYDAVNSLYGLAFTPTTPLVCKRSVVLKILNPTAGDITLLDFVSTCWYIADKKAYIKSIREIFG